MEENKGFLHSLFTGGNVVEFDPSKFQLQDLVETMDKIKRSDLDRREILDKEYTPIEDITLKELEDAIATYGDNIPKGLYVKVRWCGLYNDVPIMVLLQFFRQLPKILNQGENDERSVARDAGSE